MKIDLHQHPYKDWMILSQEKIPLPVGSSLYKITFAKDQSLCERIIKAVMGVLAVLATLGLILFSKGFREFIKNSWKERIVVDACSSTSLESFLWQRILTAPSTKKLFFEAHGELLRPHKEIGIRFLSHKDPILPEGSFGSASLATAEILLKLGRTERDVLGTMLFELTNFKHIKRWEEVDQKVFVGAITTSDEYAKECEKIEYDGIMLHRDAVQAAILSHGWHSDIDQYDRRLQSDWKTFDHYWEDVKDGAHAHYYRRVFQNLIAQKKAAE